MLNRYRQKLAAYYRKYGPARTVFRFITEGLNMLVRPLARKLWIERKPLAEDLIVFYSIPSYSDNSKALYNYLLGEPKYSQYRFIWLMGEDAANFTPNARATCLPLRSRFHGGNTYAAQSALWQARYIFTSHTFHLDKHPGQVVVNLWHGCGYKAAHSQYVQNNLDFDWFLVPGDIFVQTKSRYWGIPEDRLLTMGYPRYDLFLRPCDRAREFADSLRRGNRLVIWMPTFRNPVENAEMFQEASLSAEARLPLIRSAEQLEQVNDHCRAQGTTLCVKVHTNQRKYIESEGEYSNIRFLYNEDLLRADVDLYALLRYTDALISDYSSVAVDYLLLDRPLAYTLDDYAQFKSSRGFVFEDPLQYMPGAHLYTAEDLMAFIDIIARGDDCWRAERGVVKERMHNPCANYSARLADFILG